MKHLDSEYMGSRRDDGAGYVTRITLLNMGGIDGDIFDLVYDRIDVLKLRFLPELNEVLKTQIGEL